MFSFTLPVLASGNGLENNSVKSDLSAKKIQTEQAALKNRKQHFKIITWTAELSCGTVVIITADVDNIEDVIDITMAVDWLVCELGLISVK